jgi:hypothetical protein
MTAEPLPDWLEHYLCVPAWVLFKSLPENEILWVNESLARNMAKDRRWFVGRDAGEVWIDSRADSPGYDRRAVEENRVIDAISYGHDLNRRWRWLSARLTPVGKRRVLIICEDITARIRLAGLRLVLGRSVAGEPRGRFGESFARKLLEGATLEDLCASEGLQPAEVLGKLGRMVADQSAPGEGIRLPDTDACEPATVSHLPDWLGFYWDLPGPAIFLSYPELDVLWVNHFVLERNEVRQEDVVGMNVYDLWSAAEIESGIVRAMREHRCVDTLRQGQNLQGRQQWMFAHITPVGTDRILVLGENVTADIQLQALRLLLGLNPAGPDAPVKISDAFARLLLDGASVANICAALEMPADEVLGQAGLIMGNRAS